MKRYILLSLFLISLGFVLSSCDSSTDPDPITDKGAILVQSSPAGAQIWVDNVNTNKTTPDSVTNLSVGNHSVTLKLAGHRDTTVIVNVVKDLKTTKFVQLTSSVDTVVYGPVRLWETTGTSASQPSGLDLSTGMAHGVSGSNANLNDIYYSSNGFVVRSANNAGGNNTSFFVGNGTNLMDGEDSPLATSSWGSSVADTQSKYFFLFDSNSHYSKMIITSRGGGTPGNPAWVEVKWVYNKKANNTNF